MAASDHTQRHTHYEGVLWTRDRSDARPLTENTQDPQGTDFHTLGGIRTRNPRKRAAADPRLRDRAATGIDLIL